MLSPRRTLRSTPLLWPAAEESLKETRRIPDKIIDPEADRSILNYMKYIYYTGAWLVSWPAFFIFPSLRNAFQLLHRLIHLLTSLLFSSLLFYTGQLPPAYQYQFEADWAPSNTWSDKDIKLLLPHLSQSASRGPLLELGTADVRCVG